jgi:lipopolysaccharide cholinephosphotransferase
MKKMTSDDIKECSFNVLLYIDNICRENNIQYYLCGGTLLGAIRHQGFIPWDDDIDIMLPRQEYDKLLSCFPSDGRYKMMKPLVDKGYPYPYAKVIDCNTIKDENLQTRYVGGIDVDVFPIDTLPADREQCINYFNEIERFSLKLDFLKLKTFLGRNFIFTALKYALSYYYRVIASIGFTSIDKVLSSFINLAKKYNTEESDYCGITSISHYGIKERNLTTTYSPTVYVQFESHQFPAPGCYDVYLSNLYGKNYMELPPVEKRITHHSFDAYWK